MIPISENPEARYTYLIALPRLRLAYVELAKCGCSGLKKLCITLDRDIPYTSKFGVAFPDWSPMFPECVVPSINKLPDGLELFTVVRDPFTRLVSAYRSRWRQRRPNDTFRQFIETLDDGRVFKRSVNDYWSNHFRPVTHFIPKSRPCRIFRLEDDPAELLATIYRHSGQEPIAALPVAHRSEGRYAPVTATWEPDLVGIVRRHYAEDFQLGRYPTTPPPSS